MQLCYLHAFDFLDKESKDVFVKHIVSVMHKLTATKYHLKNYIRIESEMFTQAVKGFKRNPNQNREAFELIHELEAFLFQLKSSLDVMVKVLQPILRNNCHIRTTSFGDKGDKIIKGLESLKKNKKNNVQAIDNLISLIKDDKDSWLETTIKFRDELNHYEALSNYTFKPMKLPNGQLTAIKPKFRDMETVRFMRLVYANNIEFQQDFITLALLLRLPGSICLVPAELKEVQKFFNDHDSCKYIKWGFAMLNPVT